MMRVRQFVSPRTVVRLILIVIITKLFIIICEWLIDVESGLLTCILTLIIIVRDIIEYVNLLCERSSGSSRLSLPWGRRRHMTHKVNKCPIWKRPHCRLFAHYTSTYIAVRDVKLSFFSDPIIVVLFRLWCIFANFSFLKNIHKIG